MSNLGCRASARSLRIVGLGLLVAILATEHAQAFSEREEVVTRRFAEGRDLFVKTWEPGQASPSGGDGLGPVYNADSCVACHHQGGVGGGGPRERDVMLLVATPPQDQQMRRGDNVFPGELGALHHGFLEQSSIVLHKSAIDPEDQSRLDHLRTYDSAQTRRGLVTFIRPVRNTPALFGAGHLDAIGERDLESEASRDHPQFPDVSGRVARSPNGTVGRFGWKAQVPTLRDFVMAACSNELGLEVPNRHQVSLEPLDSGAPPAPLDLDADQCDLLVRFVRDLPAPETTSARGIWAARGRQAFNRTGCAACHTPDLGDVRGIYSDLLLHDMGTQLLDVGTYYGIPTGPSLATAPPTGEEPTGPATASEWRTPPLWGVADSAPYLHDGRADDLDEAIRLHGGEAGKSVELYRKLPAVERRALLALLKSFKAPG